jgi:hypothetical protein
VKGIKLFVSILAYLGILTSSFDIFLVLDIGFSLRACVLLFIPLIWYSFSLSLINRKAVLPVGFIYLSLWAIINFLFSFNTNLLSRSFVYSTLLFFSCALVFSFAQFFRNLNTFLQLIRFYIVSFSILSILGIVQFVLPVLGLPALFIEQWWIPGLIARVNAFSYEPSYYATYLLAGWGMLTYLNHQKEYLFSPRLQKFFYLTISLALFLSSSRISLVIMILWYSHYLLKLMLSLFTLKIKIKDITNGLIFLVVCGLIITYLFLDTRYSFLLQGTGINSTATHSVSIRGKDFFDTLSIFLNSPVIGYSLGGVAVAIGNLRGVYVNSNEIAQSNEGLNIFAEALAATGIIGFVILITYFSRFFLVFTKISRTKKSIFEQVYIALFVGFLLEIFAMQFNQNILRVYFWVHISILSLSCFFLKNNSDDFS